VFAKCVIPDFTHVIGPDVHLLKMKYLLRVLCYLTMLFYSAEVMLYRKRLS
jgi:hypothetical protein